MEDSKMKKHVTVVGAIHVGLGILGLIGAVGAFLVFTLLLGAVGDEKEAKIIFTILRISVPILLGFMATLGLVGGIGLFSYQAWARYVVLVVAALSCLFIPIGTLSGVYAIWVLMQDDTVKLFENK